MRYKFCAFTLFVIFLCTFSFVHANNQEFSLIGKVIYIDIGHGGNDPGAMYKDILEKDINLQVGKILEQKLLSLGAIVYLTRYDDYDLSVTYTINNKRSDLSRRGNMINRSECDLFLSIHLNAEETGVWRGAQVFYNNKLEENKKIAELIQKYFKKNLNSTRKAKVDNELYLLKRIDRPGVLLELGFLSNANDRYLLRQDSYQNKIANTIVSAIQDYFTL